MFAIFFEDESDFEEIEKSFTTLTDLNFFY